MKTLRALHSSTPRIAQLGLSVLLAGLVADLAVHIGGVSGHPHAGIAALIAHLTTVLGMVLVLVGVVQVAVERVRRSRKKGGNDAARSSTAAAR